MRVVGCFLKHEDKFVILLRHPHKPEGNTWGLPGGKVDSGETDAQAMIRELHEETGYLAHHSELTHLGEYTFIQPSQPQPVQYITYQLHLSQPHEVTLEDTAHADYKWVTAPECDNMPDLISGFQDLLRMVNYIEES